MNDSTTWAKVRYLDASAIVGLYVRETHSDRIRDFVNDRARPFSTTSLCFAETFNVLKRKWKKKQISVADYLKAINEVTTAAWGKEIEVEDFGMFDPFLHKDVERLVEDYRIDVADALQLLTIQRGINSRFGPESTSVLVTLDADLAAAAEAEGVRVWNCAAGPPPDWA